MPLLPETIIAGGKERAVLRHVHARARQRLELTASRISGVLDNWLVRCVSVDTKGREGLTHWGLVNYEGKEYLMRVVTNVDTGSIASAYLDRKATRDWQAGKLDYFRRRCLRDMEVRNVSESEI